MLLRNLTVALMMVILISTGWFNNISAQDGDTQDNEIAWFDFDHCEICKNMASMKTDMHNIKWEMNLLDNGVIMVSVVPKKMKQAMSEAEKGVQATVTELESGKELKLCGFCNTYGDLMAMGAQFKDLKTVGVDISIITSSDPEVVKKIQEFGKRSSVEHDRMVAKYKPSANSKKDK